MTEVLFFIAAIGAIAGAVGVVWLQNPFFSVLALVFHLLSLAALFLLLQAQFVAAAQVVVYAGAVMVLYVFVVAYVGAAEAAHFKAPVGGTQRAFAIGFALALFVELAIAVLGSGLAALDTEGPTVRIGFGGPEQIGQALLTKFLVAFEVASFLLLPSGRSCSRAGVAASTRRRPASARWRSCARRAPAPWPRRSRAASARRSAASARRRTPARPTGRPRAPGRRRRASGDRASLLARRIRRPPARTLAMTARHCSPVASGDLPRERSR
jgi:NADH:ubiquinone oxidoreductase subunit 6 (subunit J)